jgi:S-adenosylmethionine:tRNA ribosyltransferase-isomerase
MKLSEFDYHLPKSHIAQYPVAERDSSRLMVIYRKHGEIEHRIFRDIVEYLYPGDVLILNDARVIPARLYGRKPSGGKVELLLLKELYSGKWEAIVRGLQCGKVVFKYGISGYISRSNGTATVEFTGDDTKKMLNKIGVMPLPPYIRRPAEQSDARCYQTVYAEKDGAIAAPTAGLHFTTELLDRIKEKGVEVRKLTLHVGYGTFKPVSCQQIEDHQMEEEYYEIPENTADSINRAKSGGRRIIAVGTTVTRALETSATPPFTSPLDKGGYKGGVKAGAGKASIFIYPNYKFKVIDALITNFHLPKSTPLMLTSAFSGLQLLRTAYLEALNRGYRFFSYGDAMLII